MRKTFGFWKTTILGGVFFLLPFAVVMVLLGKAVEIVYLIAKPLADFVPGWSVGGMSLAFLLAIGLLLATCFLAGLAARRSLARNFTERIEKNLLVLFPRYAILKDRMAGNLGGDLARPHLKPVLVNFDDAARVGFEVERTGSGSAGSEQAGDARVVVTVFMPGAPDPWTGHVVHVPVERLAPLAADFNQAVAICETLGRQASRAIGPAAKNL